jgi:integrase/recombinase XerD
MTKLPWAITNDMFLSLSEAEALLRHARVRAAARTGRRSAPAKLDELIIEILLFSGLRTTELCRLAVCDTIMGTGESSLAVRGRGRTGRTVHLPRRVSELIQRFVKHTRPVFLPDDLSPTDTTQPLVFNERKRPYERTGLYRRVRRILEGADLGDRASVQLLRHTYGYLAYKETGGNLLFVQRQLGHAHPMITSVYARLVDESYPDMANRIDR